MEVQVPTSTQKLNPCCIITKRWGCPKVNARIERSMINNEGWNHISFCLCSKWAEFLNSNLRCLLTVQGSLMHFFFLPSCPCFSLPSLIPIINMHIYKAHIFALSSAQNTVFNAASFISFVPQRTNKRLTICEVPLLSFLQKLREVKKKKESWKAFPYLYQTLH